MLITVMLALISRKNPASPETHQAPWRYGAAAARFTVVFYADLECPYCKEYSPQLRRWIAANPDVNLQWHHLPLSMHEPAASEQARWVECAGQTGGNTAFWRAVQWVYATTRSDGRGVPDWGTFPDINAALKACAASEEASTLVQQRLQQGGASLQQRLREAWQGMTDVWSMGITTLPAIVVEQRYVVYGETDLDKALARIAQYRKENP